jgi:pyruvate/2-oxoglutarate dehydrogenase complex dihydrolipoamide acyltransferase (E2) component
MPRETKAPDATPAAADLAAEEGVDIAAIEGSGSEGRVLKTDVEEELAVRFELEGAVVAAETNGQDGKALRIDADNPILETSDPAEIAVLDAHPGTKRAS